MAPTKSTKRHTSKAERQQAREKAQERAQKALDRLGEGVRAVYDSERWESWLRSLSRFHDYSLGNTILIAMQMPNATHVASFRSWKRDFNRYVRKGEKGIEILVPMLVKDGDEDDTDVERRRLVGFRVGHVFDVSQTDGEPLPTLVDEVAGDVERYAAILDAVRIVSAYPVEFVGDLPEGTNGFFRRGELVAIREGMTEGQTVKTALHELAHSRLHEFKGIDVATAHALVVEAGDFSRFRGARQFSAWCDLVPSEHSSGEGRSTGGVTKAGNKHVRRLLVEAAWHVPMSGRDPKGLAAGQEVAPAVRRHATKGVRRLIDRRAAMAEAGKRPAVANCATARELACWVWAVGAMVEAGA